MFRFPTLLLAATLAAASLALAHNPAGTPDPSCAPNASTHDYAAPAVGLLVTNVRDGSQPAPPAPGVLCPHGDGHKEFAQGGAVLAVLSGDGVTYGSIVCYGQTAHHPAYGPVSVSDVVLGASVPFMVGADTVDLTPPTTGPDCGDFQVDEEVDCVGSCTVPFLPGADGTYQVFVGRLSAQGTAGHVVS